MCQARGVAGRWALPPAGQVSSLPAAARWQCLLWSVRGSSGCSFRTYLFAASRPIVDAFEAVSRE